MTPLWRNKNKIYKKIRKFDYSKKKLENPFFKRREKINRASNLKIKIIIVLIALFICFILWFLYFSTSLRITEISIDGLGRVPNEEVYALVEEQIGSKKFFILPQKNLFLFDELEFFNLLKNKYRFEEVIISKSWPHKLEIKIKEKPFACIWNEGDKYYYVDSDGFILEEINPLDIKKEKYTLIRNESEKKISDYKIQVDKKYMESAQELFRKLGDSSLGINIEKFIIDENIDTIKLKTEEGVKISFSTKNDLNKQIEKLIIIIREKLKEDFATKKYIDLRFGDKVYYQ